MFIVLAIEVMQGYGSDEVPVPHLALPWFEEILWTWDDAPERADREDLDQWPLVPIYLAATGSQPCS